MRRILPLLVLGAAIVAATQPDDKFSIVLIPDTQFYSLKDPATYRKQTQFIVDSATALRIRAAVHLGDITDKNTLLEWGFASQAHRILDNANIPYSVTTGNHDYASVEGESRRRRVATRFRQTFPPSRFSGQPWYGGHFGSGNETNYIMFNGAGLEFLVMNLEYAPPKDAMCWASRTLRQHATRRAIVATHCYLNADSSHNSTCDTDEDRNMVGGDGKAVWHEVVRQAPNVFLVVSGHRNGTERAARSRESGRLVDPSTKDTVHEILVDFQGQDGLHASPRIDSEHGDGWLALLQFDRRGKRVSARTKSVLGATTVNKTPQLFQPDPHLAFDYNMNSPPPSGPGTNPIPPTEIRFADRVVNPVSDGHQRNPRLASDTAGNWIAVWEDDRNENDTYQLRARGFDRDGCQQFAEITVNTSSTGNQIAPAIAADPTGRFVIVWQDDGGDDKYQIKMRGFNADGTERFPQQTVNEVAGGQQILPAIAMNETGDFVVTWQDDIGNDGKYQIKARRFNVAGSPKGGQFTVNTVADGQQRRPAIAMSRAGDFVIVWEDDAGNDGWYQVKARGFRADGSQRFAQRTVNESSTGQQLKPVVAMASDATFVVAWEDSGRDSYYQIKARGFSAAGVARYGNKTINASSGGQQRRPSIAMDAYDDGPTRGRFIVTWEDDLNDNNTYQVKARGFAADAGVIMGQVTINRNSRGQQVRPAVTLTRDGRFVVAWQDDLEENEVWEVLARGCTLKAKCEWP